MTKLTPIRWLILIAAAAAVYVATVVTALLLGRAIPQQIHSVVLTAVTGGVLVAAIDATTARRERRVHAHLHRLAQQIAEALGEEPTQPLRAVAGDPRPPSSIYRASARVSSPGGVDSNVVVVAERLTRRLSAVVED